MREKLKDVAPYAVSLLILGSLIGSLCYLWIPNEVKYSHNIAFTLFGAPVMYISAVSAWFYSDFLWAGIIQRVSLMEEKSEFIVSLIGLHSFAFCIRGAVYIVQYLEILPHDNRHRLSYFLGYIFLLSLKILYNYHKANSYDEG